MSSTKAISEQEARLAVLEASELELTQGPDAALAAVGPPSDPIRMRYVLSVLLRNERHKEAADLIRSQPVHEKWIDLAALVFAFLGDISKARSLVDQADNSPELPVFRSSRLAFAEGVFEQWRLRFPGQSFLAVREWTPADVELASTILELLVPLLSSVRANRRISGDYELGAVIYATYSARIIKDDRALSECVGWLIRHVSLPLIVAELALRGLVSPLPEGLPNRLRIKHPNDFQAAFFAALIERDLLKQFNAAFESFAKLSALPLKDDEKAAVSVSLFETCGRCGIEQVEKAFEIVTRLCPSDTRLLSHLQAMKYLVGEDYPAAKRQLEEHRNETDGVWWQSWAQLCERLGDSDGAQLAWEKASELSPHQDVVRRSIGASIDRRKYESAAAGLKKLLDEQPDNVENLRTMAWTLIQIGNHAEASHYLSRLVGIEPTNPDNRLHLAQALARSARVPEAIAALKPLIKQEDPPFKVILLQSELLAADNHPQEAFKLLEGIAPDHWDDPQFLVYYMHAAHAAGNDNAAHEPFARLLELRREGKVPAELLHEGTLEQLLQFGKEYRERRESLQQAVVLGRMPWLFVEDIVGNPPTWAWALHTQELKWLSEEPLNRAALSIYATNGFTVNQATKQLDEITASAAGTEVVLDLSALITLHRLNRLETTADYFGCLVLPAMYGDLKLRYAHRFGQHQPSREAELRNIKDAIDNRRITPASETALGIIVLDEYEDAADSKALRLADLIPILESKQSVPATALDELHRAAHKPSAGKTEGSQLKLGDSVSVELMTLRTLSHLPVFDAVLDSFTVSITEAQHQEVLAELRAYAHARAAKELNDSLWGAVAELVERKKIRWAPVKAKLDTEGADEDVTVYLGALSLAQSLTKPLLTDDRLLQVIMLQSKPSNLSWAFGSDCVLKAVQGSEPISRVASDFGMLMRWRYRFLIPSCEILLKWAEEAMDNLPGPALLEAASYLQDCLRDPGLHCGLEQSEPPRPMAARLATAWFTPITQFLARLWADDRFTAEKCAVLTRWVGGELVPSCPRGLWYHQIGEGITQAERHGIFGMALVQFTGIQNQERANEGLRTFALALGLSEDEYLAKVAETIQTTTTVEERQMHGEEASTAFSAKMMQDALLHYAGAGLDALTVSRLQELGFLRDASAPTLPTTLMAALQTSEGPTRPRIPAGPLVFVIEGQAASVMEVDTILLNPEADIRKAGLAYVKSGASSEPWLTRRSLETLARTASAVGSSDVGVWRKAAIELVAIIREDPLAHLAALRQALVCRYQEGINDFIGRAMHPKLATLVYFRPPLWSATEQREEIVGWIAEAARLPTLDAALTMHVNRCGYVPLCAEMGPPQVVRQWMSEHPEATVSWDNLWSWACNFGTPLAKYHALTVALHIPDIRPGGSLDQFWAELCTFLEPSKVAEDGGARNHVWELYCDLASHFARHLESLHPGQHGERVACYAWWLADQLGRLIGRSDAQAKQFLEKIVTPEAEFSYFRWTVTRSPIGPSHFRHSTLHLNSVWTMSLVAQLGATATTFPAPGFSEHVREVVGKALHGFLVASHLGEKWGTEKPVFGFHDNARLEDLCNSQGYIPEEIRQALAELLLLKRELSDVVKLTEALSQFSDIAPHIQHLIILAIKDAVYSTAKYDTAIANFLSDTTSVIQLLLKSPDYIVDPFLEMLAEFQQHHVENWPIRLPHVLAYAIEKCNDPERVRKLAPHVLQLSHNGGTGSPVQRLVHARKLADWHEVIGIWRDNLVMVGVNSEAWVAARVRGTSAVISKLIGPRRADSRDE